MIETYKEIANRLQYARKQCGYTLEEIGEKIGINKGTISRWESGETKNIKLPILEKLASIYNVNVSWLSGNDAPMYAKPTNANNYNNIFFIPVLGNISAGTPLLATENITGYLPIDPNFLHAKTTDGLFFLKVQGDSMNKTFKNGSYILVRQQNTIEDNEIVVAIVNGDNEATVKRFKHTDNAQFIQLVPESNNDKYQTRIIDLKHDNFIILGKVIGNMSMDI